MLRPLKGSSDATLGTLEACDMKSDGRGIFQYELEPEGPTKSFEQLLLSITSTPPGTIWRRI